MKNYLLLFITIPFLCFANFSSDSEFLDTEMLTVQNSPVLTLLGLNPVTIFVGSIDGYIDDGATCFDIEDGVISQDVELSGQVVNINNIGTGMDFVVTRESNQE